jgi:hypothetical protein
MNQSSSDRREIDIKIQPGIVFYGLGVISGIVFGIAASAFGQTESGADPLLQRMLYAISELAGDTEVNAARIEKIDQRLDILEDELERLRTKN